MTVTLSEFGQLTTPELVELHFRAYSWGIRFYLAAAAAPGTSAAPGLLAAARELSAVHDDLRDALRDRRDARQEASA